MVSGVALTLVLFKTKISCSKVEDFDWDMKVELLGIELEAIRKEIEELAKKFDRMEKKFENEQ